MSVGVASSRSTPQVHERLQRLLLSLRELEQRRLSQRVLVRSVLDLNPVLVRLKNPDLDCGRRLEEELKERPERKSGRSLDTDLKSELQDLDRQILKLRLDAAWSHAPPLTPESPAPDSRPSSGFFSDGASRSNSAFSLCSEATPTSPVTPPSAAEAPPPVSGVPRSVSAPSSAPPLSPPPLSHLDKFILSLLQRRTLSSTQTKTSRPVLIQTSLSHRTGATGRLTPPPGAPPTLTTGRLTPPPGAPPTLTTGRLTPPPGAPPTLTTGRLTPPPGAPPTLTTGHLTLPPGAPPTLTTGHLTPPPGAPPTLTTGHLTPPTAGRLTPPTLTVEGAAVSNRRKATGVLRFQMEERQFGCDESEEQRRRRSHRRRSRRKHLTHGVREGSPAKTKRGRGERRRKSEAEEDQDRASLHSHCVKSHDVKLRRGQSQSSRAMMSPEHSEGGVTEEETGSEGEHTGRGGTRRLQLVRIKASRNLKRRILRQKTATFTLMTTI